MADIRSALSAPDAGISGERIGNALYSIGENRRRIADWQQNRQIREQQLKIQQYKIEQEVANELFVNLISNSVDANGNFDFKKVVDAGPQLRQSPMFQEIVAQRLEQQMKSIEVSPGASIYDPTKGTMTQAPDRARPSWKQYYDAAGESQYFDVSQGQPDPNIWSATDPTKKAFTEAGTEGRQATTEQTKARTENIQKDTILDQLNYELKQEESKDKSERNQAYIDNVKSQIEYRSKALEIRRQELESKRKDFNYEKEYKQAYDAYIRATGRDIYGKPEPNKEKWTDLEGAEIALKRMREIREKAKTQAAPQGMEQGTQQPADKAAEKGKIRVIGPNGETGTMDESEFAEASKHGWRKQ